MKMGLFVDYQYDFVEGSLGFPGAELLDEGLVAWGQGIVAEGGIIVETADTHPAGYLNTREGRALPIIHTVPGTPGWEPYGKTGFWLKNTQHIVIRKSTFGCPPEALLKLPDNIDVIEVGGLVSNMCVLSNVCCFQARYPEAQIIVHRKLCASFDPELHEKTMAVLEGIQVKVVD